MVPLPVVAPLVVVLFVVQVVVVVVPTPETDGELEAARRIRVVTDVVCRSDVVLVSTSGLVLVHTSGVDTTRVSSSMGSVCISKAPGGSMETGMGRLW